MKRTCQIVAVVGLVVVQLVTLTTTVAAYQFGAEPRSDLVVAAEQTGRNCAVSNNELAAMAMATAIREVAGGSQTSTPSPMTLSRYDNQAGLYAFADRATPYRGAFFHPGVGMFQLDSAGMGAGVGAHQAINTADAGRVVVQRIAARYCQVGGTPAQRRAAAWAPWFACDGGSCEPVFNSIMSSGFATDFSVGRLGGMEERQCQRGGQVFTCWFVDPGRAQGATWWRAPNAGPAPISAPFYTFVSAAGEERHWLAGDTGYDRSLSAVRPLGSNARNSLTWYGSSDISLGVPPPPPPSESNHTVVVRESGEVNVVARGVDDSLRYFVSFPGGPFSELVIAGPGSAVSAPAVAVRPSGEVNVVARRADNSLWYYFALPGEPFVALEVAGPSSAYSAPDIVVRESGEVNISVRGLFNSLQYYYAFPAQPFHHVQVAGISSAVSAPAMAVRPSGEVNIVAQTPDNGLVYYLSFPGEPFVAIPLAGPSSSYSAPDIVVRDRGEVNISMRGLFNSLQYYYAFPSQPFHHVQVAGISSALSAPAMVVRPSGEVNIAVQTPDHGLTYYLSFPGEPFVAIPVSGPNTTYSAPGIALRASGEVDLAARGLFNSLEYWFAFPSQPFNHLTIAPIGTVID